ncbi:hypothetical protein E2562_032735 [Oryza meyeriana var. granulata]|uniref:Uncharacterized protein n=1 Tax=Oryza meyeriana var. granulata TaxID=110450 RepID=A0A6G1ES86_9ORYZ|nr:hypothetical protein E2562_032735 [Oryza meyeriana var. granulata]
MEVLSRYDPATTPAADAKMALAKFIVMVTEPMRLKRVSRAIGERWDEESYLSSDEMKIVPYWGEISTMLMEWNSTGRWGDLGPRSMMDRARCPRPARCEDKDDDAGELYMMISYMQST